VKHFPLVNRDLVCCLALNRLKLPTDKTFRAIQIRKKAIQTDGQKMTVKLLQNGDREHPLGFDDSPPSI
jgi:hypothetical protein